MRTDIDVSFDFRRDTPEGRDPDSHSKTLRHYHKLLWSKRLPSGEFFDLEETNPGSYLFHRSALGEFWLTSDAVIPTFKWHKSIKTIISDDELNAFNALGYTIGGMMVFPGNRINGKWTINQARGCTKQIRDRFDLTLECIRRYYLNEKSPLSDVLARYGQFFNLFVNFRGYIEYFLLQDLVSDDFVAVKLSTPFDNFNSSPIPTNVDEYRAYENASCVFIKARNQRILHASN